MSAALHIIEQLSDFGGTPRKLLYLAQALDPQVSRLIIATYQDSALADEFAAAGVEIINLETLSFPALVTGIVRLIKHHKANIVCSHLTRPLFAGFLASRMCGVPWLHFEHSSAAYRNGLKRHGARVCLPFADAVICNSQHTARSIEQTYALRQDCVRILPNPVQCRSSAGDREAIRRGLGVATDAVVIGHVGGMIAARDQQTLIEAFGRLYQEHSASRLILIGDGPERARLETSAAECGLGAAVIFLGYRQDIGDCLQAMDIYVNPTLDEGFGIAVVEAMLAELPVVLADSGAHPELVEHGRTGWLYRGGDAAGLHDSLSTLLASSELRRQLGRNAVECATVRFSVSRYADGYAAIINEFAVPASRASMLKRSEPG